jgi:hypothetical protein
MIIPPSPTSAAPPPSPAPSPSLMELPGSPLPHGGTGAQGMSTDPGVQLTINGGSAGGGLEFTISLSWLERGALQHFAPGLEELQVPFTTAPGKLQFTSSFLRELATVLRPDSGPGLPVVPTDLERQSLPVAAREGGSTAAESASSPSLASEGPAVLAIEIPDATNAGRELHNHILRMCCR